MPDNVRAIDPDLFDEATPLQKDFFRHVNGGWLDANPVPAEYPSWGAFNEVNDRNQQLLRAILDEAAVAGDQGDSVTRMVGDYHAAAMDEAAIAAAGTSPIAGLLDRIAAIDSVEAMRPVAAELCRAGVGSLLGAGVSADFEDSDAYLTYVGQGGLGLPERDYYLRDDEGSAGLCEAYLAHVATQLATLGYEPERASEAAEAILGFETRLATASMDAATRRDVTKTLNRYAVDSLDELMPGFSLTAFVRDIGVTSESVCIDNPEFFSALDETLAQTPAVTLRDYLTWHLVRTYASALPPAFETEAFGFYGKRLGGQQAMKPRWKRAIEWISADAGELLSQLYVARHFSEDAKHRCEEMVDHLLSAMGRAISGAEWMSDSTKEQARAKLAGFSYKIGYPDRWRDWSGLRVGRESLAANRMAAAVFEHDREMGRLGEPVDRGEWGMPPHVINAYYHPLLNEIVFPAGILQPPFFYPDADDAVNYGAIGAVIGHEITHGFDDNGSRFDANGALRDWWTQADRDEFTRRADVLVEQFNGYEIEPGVTVNGKLTLGENIADLGGLKIAYDALVEAGGTDGPVIDGFTPAQRFFLSWATVWRTNYTPEYARLLVNIDPHSPAQYRVNSPLANTPAFAAAFGVAEGTPMQLAAADRAQVW